MALWESSEFLAVTAPVMNGWKCRYRYAVRGIVCGICFDWIGGDADFATNSARTGVLYFAAMVCAGCVVLVSMDLFDLAELLLVAHPVRGALQAGIGYWVLRTT